MKSVLMKRSLLCVSHVHVMLGSFVVPMAKNVFTVQQFVRADNEEAGFMRSS